MYTHTKAKPTNSNKYRKKVYFVQKALKNYSEFVAPLFKKKISKNKAFTLWICAVLSPSVMSDAL